MKRLWILLCLLPTLVLAHTDGQMKYPYECCHDNDCGPVLDYMYFPDPIKPYGLPMLEVTVMLPDPASHIHEMKKYKIHFPADFPRRPSTDGRMHACALVYKSPPKPLCLFMPDAGN